VRPWRWAALLAVAGLICGLLLLACPAETPVPGDAIIGTFKFTPTPYQDSCQFVGDGGDGGFPDFYATLSYSSKGGDDAGVHVAYLNSGATQLHGTWDGVRFVVGEIATRDLPWPCVVDGGICEGTISETVDVQILSEAQVTADGCDGLGAGDGGTLLSPDGGSEARLVCGWLTDEFRPGDAGSCTCGPCLVVYSIKGERQ